MSNFSVVVGRLAGIISLIAFVPYIISTLRRKTRPNRASWWIWTAVGVILGTSYHSSGANNTIWVPVSYVIGPFIIAIISLKYGEGGWTKFDRSCLIGAAASVILWFTFKEPIIALLVCLTIDLLGALPTIRKAYKDPEGEDKFAWGLFFVGNTLNLSAVEKLSFAILVYPLYMFVANGLITFFVFRRRQKSGGES